MVRIFVLKDIKCQIELLQVPRMTENCFFQFNFVIRLLWFSIFVAQT